MVALTTLFRRNRKWKTENYIYNLDNTDLKCFMLPAFYCGHRQICRCLDALPLNILMHKFTQGYKSKQKYLGDKKSG